MLARIQAMPYKHSITNRSSSASSPGSRPCWSCMRLPAPPSPALHSTKSSLQAPSYRRMPSPEAASSLKLHPCRACSARPELACAKRGLPYVAASSCWLQVTGDRAGFQSQQVL